MQDTSLNNELISLLSSPEYDNLSDAEILRERGKMKRKRELKTKYEDKIKQRKDGRFYIRINGHQIYGKSIDELYEKLYEIDYGRENSSLSDLFENWKEYKLTVEGRSTKTIRGYQSIWDNYLKGTDISKKPIKELKAKDYKTFFGKTVIKHQLTQKYFSELKSVINGILDYATDEEIIEYNCVKNLKTDSLAFRVVDEDEKAEEVYSIDDRTKLLNYLDDKDDLYSLAMQLDMYTIMRIGEVLALKWSDFKEDSFRIQRQLIREVDLNSSGKHTKYKWVLKSYVKGRKKNGFRDMPITSGTRKILERIKEINPNSEYLFITESGEILYQDTFNEKLKDACNEIGIGYFSSHKIRFCVASYLYIEGISIHKIQKLLGHTTLKMTLHYLRNVKKDETILDDMEKILCAN